jgi:hypothetical protein
MGSALDRNSTILSVRPKKKSIDATRFTHFSFHDPRAALGAIPGINPTATAHFFAHKVKNWSLLASALI